MEIIINNCGSGGSLEELESLKNDPNFVFQNDPNFEIFRENSVFQRF